MTYYTYGNLSLLTYGIDDVREVYCLYETTLYVTDFCIYNEKGSKLPIELSPSITVKTITGGAVHYCVLLSNKTMYLFPDSGDVNTYTIYNDIGWVTCGYYHTVYEQEGVIYGLGRSSDKQLGFESNVTEGTPLLIPPNPVKVVTGSHTTIALYSDGIAYATGVQFNSLGSTKYEGFKPLEPFHSKGLYIKDIWVTSILTYVKTSDGIIYFAGSSANYYHFDGKHDSKDFTVSEFLTLHRAYYLTGLYSLIAFCEDGVYVCGRNYQKQLHNSDLSLKPIKHSLLTELNAKHPIHVCSSFSTISIHVIPERRYIKRFRNLMLDNPVCDIIIQCV